MKKAVCALLAFLLVSGMSLSGGADMNNEKPIKEVSVHDPSIIKDNDGTYYVFGSHITTAKSTDMINWDYTARGYKREENVHFGNLSENLKGSFKWAGEDDGDCKGGFAVWAPDVYYNPKYLWKDGSRGAYMMYYSASSTYKRSCIGLAVSKEINGVYEYVDTVIYSGFTKIYAKDENSDHSKQYTKTNIYDLIQKGRVCSYKDDWGIDDYNSVKYPNAIDPCVYEDEKGRLYLTYGSWSGGIFTLPINPLTGIPVYPGFDSVTEDGRMVDRYFGTHIAGGKGWSGEGPFIYYDQRTGYYYLQTSYEWLGTDGGYHIRMFRSESPTGPFTDMLGNSAVYGKDHAAHGVKMFSNHYFTGLNAPYTSGGHCSTLTEGDETFIFFHTRFKGVEHFKLKVHQMFVNEDGWMVVAPFGYKGSKISPQGYSDAEIIGMYEFIDHGSRIGEGTKVATPKTVMLLNNGKIKGAVSGRWTVNGKYVTFYINDDVYKGVFFKQLNEKDEEVMTFSLVGGKNSAIWGIKANSGDYTAKTPAVEISFEDGLSQMETVKRNKGQNPYVEKVDVTYEDGYKGKAIKLDGSFGLQSENIPLSTDMTISFMMKPDKLSTYSPIAAITEDFIGNGKDKWFSLTTFTNGKDAVLWSRNAEREQWLEGKSAVPFKMGQWQHVLLVFDPNYYGGDENCISCRLYLDGLCIAAGSVTKEAFTDKSKLFFGINPWDDCYTGLIDEIKIFYKAFNNVDAFAYYNNYSV